VIFKKAWNILRVQRVVYLAHQQQRLTKNDHRSRIRPVLINQGIGILNSQERGAKESADLKQLQKCRTKRVQYKVDFGVQFIRSERVTVSVYGERIHSNINIHRSQTAGHEAI
jgi:hypothetical protein